MNDSYTGFPGSPGKNIARKQPIIYKYMYDYIYVITIDDNIIYLIYNYIHRTSKNYSFIPQSSNT